MATVNPFDSLVSCVVGAGPGATASGISTPGRASVSGTSTRLPEPKLKTLLRKLFLLAATAGAACRAVLKARAARGSCSREDSMVGEPWGRARPLDPD